MRMRFLRVDRGGWCDAAFSSIDWAMTGWDSGSEARGAEVGGDMREGGAPPATRINYTVRLRK